MHMPRLAMSRWVPRIAFLQSCVVLVLWAPWSFAQERAPAHPRFEAVRTEFNYIRRPVEIPMRDGVKLHGVVLVPKGVTRAGIVLTMTPYNAEQMTSHGQAGGASGNMEVALQGYDNPADVIVQDKYIRVVVDVRGKYGSGGSFIMTHTPPLQPGRDPKAVNDATDVHDTIDWLVKHIPESNGKVGIVGISYDGYEALMALADPHPALKVAVPMNPQVDGWMGDDWFHYGAFRLANVSYVYEQAASRANTIPWWSNYFHDYDLYMHYVSSGALGKSRGMENLPFWRKEIEHPAYDAYWRDQAVDRILANRPLKVPVMLVEGLYDNIDIYGAMAVYRALAPKDTRHDKVRLVIGPWTHGQQIGRATSVGPIRFGSDTGLYFRQHVLRPFLARYLKNDPPKESVAPVTAYVTGSNHWEQLDTWPAGCRNGCSVRSVPLFLLGGHRLGFQAPAKDHDAGYDEYVSDPHKPVPSGKGLSAGNEREASGRPDVLVYESPVLTRPLKISGRPQVHLVASTSGTDSDWVVKLVDVYPPQVADEPELGGYQLIISGEIFRGRYREDLAKGNPLPPGQPLQYQWYLPVVNHVFLPGHRVMIQVQSSWFPLYDRNPQKFVPNIFFAKPSDYSKAVQRIYHSPHHASYIELPVVSGGGYSGS